MSKEMPTNPGTRLLQVFWAKIVLEVFGGGGAIWGFSEVLTLRNSDNADFWRPTAAIVGGIFFYRFNLQIRDFVNNIASLNDGYLDRVHWTRLLQIFSAKIVLEVFGGGGAIWVSYIF